MAQKTSLTAFLAAVEDIRAEGPSYRLGGSGDDGTCDCIGLIMGALARCGVSWPGIHGSNWAARNAMDWLMQVSAADDLAVGDIVYKARKPGVSGYSLPSRYAGDPDRTDYYHVGVVRSVQPLEIVHCTSPGVVVDRKLGKWTYHGRLSMVQDEGSGETMEEAMEMTTVVASSGKSVNLRSKPEKGAALVERVPVGAQVEVLARGSGWCRVRYGRYEGYMMAEFLTGCEEAQGGESVTLERAWAAVRDLQERVAALEGGAG
ncbi:MAG: SH3 domain-containing protein [Aristaeellaceae bacterium]